MLDVPSVIELCSNLEFFPCPNWKTPRENLNHGIPNRWASFKKCSELKPINPCCFNRDSAAATNPETLSLSDSSDSIGAWEILSTSMPA